MLPRRDDVIAGVTLAVVGIPQAIAYAELAGLPADRGILTAGVAAILGALLGSSPSLQTGVTALASLLTLGVLADQAPVGGERYIALAGLLAIEVGLIRMLLSAVRLGRISYALSQPVIVGLSTGAGATIVASQVPAVAGMSTDAGKPILDAVDVFTRAADVDPVALLSAATVILLLVALPRLNRRMPTPLLALVAGGVVASLLGGVDVVTLQQPVLGVSWTELAPGDVVALSMPAAVLALVGFSEASAIARRYATQDRSRWDPNRELLGQGAASLGAGIVGGFPISGSFARTSLARLAGARTRAAAITSGVLVLALVPFISWLPPIPSPALGAVVMAAGVSLIDFDGLRRLYQSARLQFAVAAGTLAATLVFSPRIDIAVLVGVGLAAAVHMFREEQLRIVVDRDGRGVRLLVEGVVFFASAPRLADAVSDSIAAGGVDRVEIDLSRAGRVDVTGVLTIAGALEDLAEAGIAGWVSRVPAHARRLVARLLDTRFLNDPNDEHLSDR